MQRRISTPTSLGIKNDSFLVLDSSNYSLKEYDISIHLNLKMDHWQAKENLKQFDRCNSLSLSDSDDICLI